MKNRYLAGLLLVGVISFSSCTKTVTETRQVDQAFSVTYDVKSNSWGDEYSNGVHHYYCDLRVDEIDDYVVKDGAVIVYFSFDNGNTYAALPHVYDGVSYNANHSKGSIALEMHALDYGTLNGIAVKAKVVIVDATPLN